MALQSNEKGSSKGPSFTATSNQRFHDHKVQNRWSEDRQEFSDHTDRRTHPHLGDEYDGVLGLADAAAAVVADEAKAGDAG